MAVAGIGDAAHVPSHAKGSDCRKLTLASTSSRIEVDGHRLESRSYHVFVQVADPREIDRVWGQLLPKAMVTPDPPPFGEQLHYAHERLAPSGGAPLRHPIAKADTILPFRMRP
jgi:hypothetical protein